MSSLEDALQELSKDGNLEAAPAQQKLRTTMVALATVGETDHRKVRWFAKQVWREAMQGRQSAIAQRARMGGTAERAHHASGRSRIAERVLAR